MRDFLLARTSLLTRHRANGDGDNRRGVCVRVGGSEGKRERERTRADWEQTARQRDTGSMRTFIFIQTRNSQRQRFITVSKTNAYTSSSSLSVAAAAAVQLRRRDKIVTRMKTRTVLFWNCNINWCCIWRDAAESNEFKPPLPLGLPDSRHTFTQKSVEWLASSVVDCGCQYTFAHAIRIVVQSTTAARRHDARLSTNMKKTQPKQK